MMAGDHEIDSLHVRMGIASNLVCSSSIRFDLSMMGSMIFPNNALIPIHKGFHIIAHRSP